MGFVEVERITRRVLQSAESEKFPAWAVRAVNERIEVARLKYDEAGGKRGCRTPLAHMAISEMTATWDFMYVFLRHGKA